MDAVPRSRLGQLDHVRRLLLEMLLDASVDLDGLNAEAREEMIASFNQGSEMIHALHEELDHRRSSKLVASSHALAAQLSRFGGKLSN